MRSRAFLALIVAAMFSGPVHAEAPIKIGVLLPFNSVFGLYSTGMVEAMKIALEEEGGKVAGRPVELVVENDDNQPPEGLSKTKKLILSDQVDLLIGGMASHVAIAISPYAIQQKTPLIIVNAGADVLTGKHCSPWVIRVSFSSRQIAAPGGPWFFEKGYKNIYLITADYSGGRTILEAFKETFVKAGGTIVGEAYTPYQETRDWAPYLAKAKAANPDAIYVFYAGGEAISFVKQYDQFGLRGQIPLVGTAWTVSPLFMPAEGKAALGFVGTINYVPSLSTPENKKFKAAYEARTKQSVHEIAVQAYDAMKIALLGLKAVNGRTDDKSALARSISQVSYASPRGPLKIDPKTNNVIQNIYVVEAKEVDGDPQLVVLDTIQSVQDPPNGCKL